MTAVQRLDGICLRYMDFDADAFAVPFYRVVEFASPPRLEDEVARLLAQSTSVVIDAKRPADDLAGARRLLGLGFHKICMQIDMSRELPTTTPARTPAVEVGMGLDLAVASAAAHAENFACDRFSQDPRLAEAGIRRLYRKWIANSLSGSHVVVSIGEDFCTFGIERELATIDLVSVRGKRRGIGKGLIEGAVAAARARGCTRMAVTTECENVAAWQLYRGCGFGLDGFTQVFHLVV